MTILRRRIPVTLGALAFMSLLPLSATAQETTTTTVGIEISATTVTSTTGAPETTEQAVDETSAPQTEDTLPFTGPPSRGIVEVALGAMAVGAALVAVTYGPGRDPEHD